MNGKDTAGKSDGLSRRGFLALSAAAGATACLPPFLTACSPSQEESEPEVTAPETTLSGTFELDPSAWQYDDADDVFYQLGVGYCTSPVTTECESMGIFVPGAYMDWTPNEDGTFTCAPKPEGAKGEFTAESAPIVMPIVSPKFAAQNAPTAYDEVDFMPFIDKGLIYVLAGFRGCGNGYDENGDLLFAGGAPWGVTDLKAAVRTLRYNADNLPGDCDRIFTFGHGGGGGLSAAMGASGDADGYVPYLESIGAPLKDAAGKSLSDAIYGSMCWCPITCFDHADSAYEWSMGQFVWTGVRSEQTFTNVLSLDLAASYATYINGVGLTDVSGNELVLEKSELGINLSGSYYDYLMGVIERSLNNFLADTTFPYTLPEGAQITPGIAHDRASSDTGAGQDEPEEPATFETPHDYIAALNETSTWVSYDEKSGEVTVASLAAFVEACKPPVKELGAFDSLDCDSVECDLFGTSAKDLAHFDAVMRNLLTDNAEVYSFYSGWQAEYPEAYLSDIEMVDDLGVDSLSRQDLYNPLYYLIESYAGYESSKPAERWRIRSGIYQSDTSLTTEVNLALAAASAVGTENVDFETIWGEGHAMVERVGTPVDNLIDWIVGCFVEPPEPEDRVRSVLR